MGKSLSLCRTESNISNKHEKHYMPVQELVKKSSEYFFAFNEVIGDLRERAVERLCAPRQPCKEIGIS